MPRPPFGGRPGPSFAPQRYLISGQNSVMTKNLSVPDWCEAPLPRPFVKADDLSGFHDLTPLHAASSWRPWMPLRAQETRAFCRVKRYPCAPESFEVMACSEPIFRPVAGLEARERAFWAGDAAAPRPRPQKAAKRPSAGGRRRRQHGAQHAPRCSADARYLPVDAVPVFRDADARPCENRPARHGSTDEGH